MNRSPFAAMAGGALGLGIPLALFLILNFMRPDLIKPMLDHIFGYALLSVVLLLGLIASTLYGFAFTGEFKSAAPRVVMIVCAVLFCTLPSMFIMLFGPIVFAFMYGQVH